MSEPRQPLQISSTTMYRVEQLERRFESHADMCAKAFKDLSDRLAQIHLEQQVHMKQTGLMQLNNEEKMDNINESIEALTTAKSEHSTTIAGLQVHQTVLEKYGPVAGASATVAGITTGLFELIMRLIGSGQGGS